MKKTYLIILFTITLVQLTFAENIRVEPEFWWTGMKNSELQLIVQGKDIAQSDMQISYPGIRVKGKVSLDNPNYLFVYLDVADAKPGKFDIIFTKGRQKITYNYELKERRPDASKVEGFNSSDVVYLIMPDRFANGDPSNDQIPMRHPYKVDRNDMTVHHGGDLLGIENRLDYLADLGVTALWLTPVLENDMSVDTYHGYACTNYYQVDPRYGSNEDYVRLVRKAQEKGIKVIMDMVFNHCGSDHPWMTDTPSLDWFNSPDNYVETNHYKEFPFDPYGSDYDKKKMTDGWFVSLMPDLNQRNPHLAKYLIQNSIWWIEYAGLNGIRQDTYPYPDKDMMAEWCKAVNLEYPDFNIVGEIWLSNTAGTAAWQTGSILNKGNDTHLKSVMDFGLMSMASNVFKGENRLNAIHSHLCYDYQYADINNVLRFYENHDANRFFTEEPKPEELPAFKQAFALLLTIPGIPQLYYGSEFLLTGSTQKDYAYVRADIPGGWSDDKANYFEKNGLSSMQREAWDFMHTVLNWRKDNDVIAKGSMKHFLVNQGVYVYERKHNDKSVLVVLNGMNKTVNLPLDNYKEVLTGIQSGKDIITGKSFNFSTQLILNPKEVLILELQ
ncbi:glycoside hydrolase family 13 protein [Parabacteroides sp. OttesenSCG-928-G07]|nr:glycoside hydrolase family 13 protein [Parabacteroides sp. OttesenSCG-928-G21]MDL2277647.1 glycoside hydrolase family 13 protein [Parabacteroides sp. OttesenSCG-928-G07]